MAQYNQFYQVRNYVQVSAIQFVGDAAEKLRLWAIKMKDIPVGYIERNSSQRRNLRNSPQWKVRREIHLNEK